VYENDDSSFNNNSYLSPYIDTSSSFSDTSDFSLTQKYKEGIRKTRTEPPLSKVHKQFSPARVIPELVTTNAANGSMTNTPPLCRTPPWKPMSSFASYGSETTPTGPTRQKLVFDDDKDKEVKVAFNRVIKEITANTIDTEPILMTGNRNPSENSSPSLSLTSSSSSL
jgi:hypothetical protein